jgi:hypothetical protein
MFITLISNNKIVFKQWGLVRGWGSFCELHWGGGGWPRSHGTWNSFRKFIFILQDSGCNTSYDVMDHKQRSRWRIQYYSSLPVFQSNLLLPSSDSRSEQVAKSFPSCLLDLFFAPEYGSSTFLRNIGNFYQTSRSHVPDGSISRCHHRGNLNPPHRNCICK